MRFSDFLKGYKLDNNLTIREISALTGVCESAINHHLYGGSVPNPRIFAKYAIILGNDDPLFLRLSRDYYLDEERAHRMKKEAGEVE